MGCFEQKYILVRFMCQALSQHHLLGLKQLNWNSITATSFVCSDASYGPLDFAFQDVWLQVSDHDVVAICMAIQMGDTLIKCVDDLSLKKMINSWCNRINIQKVFNRQDQINQMKPIRNSCMIIHCSFQFELYKYETGGRQTCLESSQCRKSLYSD